MQTPKLKSKNLFTLNRQSNQQSNPYKQSTERPPISENSSDNQSQRSEITHHQLTELRLKIRNLQKKQSALHGVIAQLENQNELLHQKFSSSESKTKELIQKLSKQQVINKQLEYKFQKVQQQIKGQKMNIESMNRTIAELALTLKQLVQSISQGPSHLYSSLERVLSLQLDINVQQAMRSVNRMAEQNHEDDKKQIYKLRSELEHEKNQKKRILPMYNQLLNKMRTNCSILKDKVDDVFKRADADKQYYDALLLQRDECIRELQTRNQKLMVSQSRRKSEQQQPPIRSFIGDKKARKQLSQIEKDILDIQKQLKQQLMSSRNL